MSGITKKTALNPTAILFETSSPVSVGIKVSDDSYVTIDNKKVVKAGTPMAGSLEARNTAFTVATTTDAVYQLTGDTALTTGKTYYTRSGSGTTASPYVYAEVSTPVVGSIDTYYEVYSPAISNAVGILLHDVDVNNGDSSGTLLISGSVNIDRIDTTTAALITAEAKTALKGNIRFLK